MIQSRRMSLAEAVTNIVIGYFINFAGQLVLYPLFHIHVSLATNILISLAFTVLSLARSYILRRTFNTLHLWGWA